MTRKVSNSLTTTAAILMLATGGMLANVAHATATSDYTMEILVDGVPLHEYHARGTTYVEAREGAEYEIRLGNHTGRRIAIALAVDGLNSIDARTSSARDARKWVLDPWETITLHGWQTGTDTARRFFFTTEDRSYGAWLGKTSNLGVVEAVVFREKRPHPVTRLWSHDKAAPGESGAPAPPDSEARSRPSQEQSPDDLAATGIGREVDHRVRKVAFRAESNPAANLRLRYEYRPQLVRLGILPWPGQDLDRREHAHGFTDSDFCPVPFAK